ncbi:hypothetical protein QSE00_15495 [Arenibacter sp. M-2]|uniref:hypothetical protein n=1 Tax=Arenibacter sp. M-2 TaxID=3053612 RepID=UPI000D86E725|nr:hypothetical protein [Arenibacter sp. M-2]MDL5513229.1 hypothetical protein [Arenibacter sp. M-2]PXX29966.1 hypothetical protein C7972_103336 [Arenibacter sp. ARW7G5Y1]
MKKPIPFCVLRVLFMDYHIHNRNVNYLGNKISQVKYRFTQDGNQNRLRYPVF